MTSWAAPALAQVRVAEGWSGADVLGGLLLGAVLLFGLLAAVFVTLRR